MSCARILVVEDESIVAEDIQEALRDLGYEVTVAFTGEQALHRVAEVQPDLVLMDVQLQHGLDGIDTAGRILEQHDTPVVYLTAFGDDHTVARARVTRPYGYLLKPFNDRELHSTIEMALSRHEMEQRLRAGEERYATTLRGIADAVLVLDHQSIVTFVNPSAEKLTGWPGPEAVGRSVEEVLHLLHEQERTPLNPVAESLRAGQTVQVEHQAVLVARSGIERPVTVGVSALRDEKAAVNGAVLVLHDMTEHRRVEERFRKAERLESIGKLAGGIAHDFNNLMTVVLAGTELLLGGRELDDQSRMLLQTVRKAGERATALTRQFLAFSRKQLAQPILLDLNDVVRHLEQRAGPWLGSAVRWETQLAPNLWTVKADLGHLQQALLNLITNARDAMGDGGLLTLVTRNVILSEDEVARFSDVAPGPYVCLTVQDTGCGMDDATRGRLFEPFFTTKDVGKGTGLGLAEVYGIVKQHGGHVEVTSAPGQGTCFRLYLPKASES